MDKKSVSRREILTAAAALGSGGLALVLPAGAKDERPRILAFSFADYAELKKIGGSTDAELPDGTQILVAHVDKDKFACVSLKCTHNNCDIEYDAEAKSFHCPCHHSRFGLDGRPFAGPARRALRAFAADPACVVKVP